MHEDHKPRTPKIFKNFLFLLWKHLRLPEPTAIQYEIADYLQDGGRRIVVEAFRGVGKSWITSAFTVWTLDHNPASNILVVSASKNRADEFSTFTLRLIREVPILQHLLPRDDQRNSKISFDVGPAPAAHAPSVKSAGITGQITGSRADLIILDDCEVVNNSETQMMRDKLSERIKETEAIIKPGGRIVYLGTPQCEQSIYNKLPERGYDVRIWPARYPGEKEVSTYGEHLAPSIANALGNHPGLVGKPTDSKRFTDEDLADRARSYGRAGFALQFQLNTSLSDAERYPLRVSDLVVMSCNPEMAPAKVIWSTTEDSRLADIPNVAMAGDYYYGPFGLRDCSWHPYQGAVMTIDPAGRGKDETAYCVVKMLHGQLFVTALGGLRGGYTEENLKALAVVAAKQKVNWIRIEANFGKH